MKTDEEMQHIVDRIPIEWGQYLRINEGWYDLVFELDAKLNSLFPQYVIYQCKEKFGGLRFYCDIDERDNEDRVIQAQAIITQAEAASYSICDDCGETGSRRSYDGYIATLCDEDDAKEQKRRDDRNVR